MFNALMVKPKIEASATELNCPIPICENCFAFVVSESSQEG